MYHVWSYPAPPSRLLTFTLKTVKSNKLSLESLGHKATITGILIDKSNIVTKKFSYVA